MPFDLMSALRDGLSDDPSIARPYGVEIRQDLAPTGGLPVQPPSYEDPLEIHKRYVDGVAREAIELDSIGSAANRLEEVLLELYRAERYPLPVSSTTVNPGDGRPITITTLEMPHRVFDAWLRLSAAEDGEGTFENSEHGRELSLAHSGALDVLLETSAHDLLLGVWDSHRKGPHGQVRIARSLTTTLTGFDPIEQQRIAARRDPLNIGEESNLPKGETPLKRLSEQGLSSIPPQRLRPGVAITEARYLGFLSFASLRRLGFERYDATDVRILLALLGLYAVLARADVGWDLRSQCELIASGDLQLTLVGAGGRREPFGLRTDDARQELEDAAGRLGIRDRGVRLEAGPALDDLVQKAIAATKAS